MAYLGSTLFTLTLVTGALAIVIASLAIYKKSALLVAISRQAVILHFLLVLSSVVALLILLASADFSSEYVVAHVNSALPVFYRLTSLWAGQAGSMLWWNFLLVMFSVICVLHLDKKEPVLVPYAIIILMVTSVFFCLLGNFSADSDPFKVIKAGDVLVPQKDGRGLNPLLQHWAMIIHPPILYLGYVSFAVPFAIAMAALWSRRVNMNWVKLVRRWTIFSWFFLGTGILLGGKWAYEELGWGGYWGWDPVENASLMPWLTGTAFLHSIIVQEKRGMLKVWNMVLVSLSFLMCIVGTFLTRSGVVSSVHAFAKSDLGPFFIVFMLAIVVFSAYLITSRFATLKSDKPINSFLSREAGFLFNNVLLLVALVAVVWGTLYPVFTETFFNERISVSAIWFNKIMAPIGLLILFLTGAGPLLAWRKTAGATLIRNFRYPMLALLVVFAFSMTVQYLNQIDKYQYMAALSFGISAFVIVGVLEEFLRATLNRTSYTRENFVLGFVLMMFQNKRRFLGYMVHLGLAIMYIGFTGKAFTHEAKLELSSNEAELFSGYVIKIDGAEKRIFPAEAAKSGKVPLYITQIVKIDVFKNNDLLGSDTSEIRDYPIYRLATESYDDNQTTSEPAIISDGFDDLYIQFAGINKKTGRMIFDVWYNPLVKFVWLGFDFFVFFGLLLLLPIGENKVLKVFRFEFSVQPVAG